LAEFLIGCSGWNCPDTPEKGGWTGIFYPDKDTKRPLISASSIDPSSGIFGLVILGIGIVVVIGGYYDSKRIQKQDKLLKTGAHGSYYGGTVMTEFTG
jgi:hypothetical protein